MLANTSVMGKRILIVVLSTIMMGLLFWLLMVVAYTVPSSQLTSHANQSRAILKQEGVLWMQNAALAGGAHYDNYTTYHMLNIAVQSADDPFADAVSSKFYQGSDPDEGLMHAIAGESNASYERYWHGYVIFLRPLLVLFNVQQIRLLCQAVFFTLLAAVVVRLATRIRMGGCSRHYPYSKLVSFRSSPGCGNATILLIVCDIAHFVSGGHLPFSKTI